MEEVPNAQALRYTVRQDSNFYKVFKKCKTLATCYLCLVYPYYAHIGINNFNSMRFYILIVLEGVFLIDFILNHVLQPISEDG